MAKTIACVLFILIAQYSYAQNGTILNGLDGDKYTPKNTENTSKKKKQESDLIGKNLISYSVSHLVRQIAVLSYERHLGNRFGIKVSGGYCFGKDLMLSTNVDEILSDNYDDKNLISLNENNTFAHKTNYYADITGKAYTNINESSFYDLLYRFYAGLSYRNYRQSYLPSNEDILPIGVNDILVKNAATSLVLGQYVYRENGFALEYYVGFGRKTSKYHGLTRDQNVNYKYVYDQNERTDNKLLITVGVAYGICF